MKMSPPRTGTEQRPETEALRTGSRGPGPLVWFTGLSGSGKSTLAAAVLWRLQAEGACVELLDADQVRRQLSGGLGFTRADREENVRRIAFVAGLLTRHGVLTLVAAISPYRAGRREARESAAGGFLEVFVDAPLTVCEQRDPVGLYRRFRSGEVRHLSGLDEPYEAPEAPEVHCRTARESLEQCADRVMAGLRALKH